VSAIPSVKHIGGYNIGITEAFWDNISPDLLVVDFIDSAFSPIPEGPDSIAFVKIPSLLRSQWQTPKYSISVPHSTIRTTYQAPKQTGDGVGILSRLDPASCDRLAEGSCLLDLGREGRMP
jgi:hypothetical protein